MIKRRFTPWVALACIGTLAACTSDEGGTTGNTELNIIVPTNAGTPDEIDIQSVEYTINCIGNDDTFLDNAASFADGVRIEGNLEVTDAVCVGGDNPGANCVNDADCQGTAPVSDGVCETSPGAQTEVWQGFMDLPPGPCTIQLRARDNDGEVICTAEQPFVITADTTTKVNLVLICDISFQAPVGMLDVDATFSFNVGNFCPDLFVLNCMDTNPPPAGTQCEVRFRYGYINCCQGCDSQARTPADREDILEGKGAGPGCHRSI